MLSGLKVGNRILERCESRLTETDVSNAFPNLRGCPHITSAVGGGGGQMLTIADDW